MSLSIRWIYVIAIYSKSNYLPASKMILTAKRTWGRGRGKQGAEIANESIRRKGETDKIEEKRE